MASRKVNSTLDAASNGQNFFKAFLATEVLKIAKEKDMPRALGGQEGATGTGVKLGSSKAKA